MEALDDLAHALRGRLIERARAGDSAGDGLEAEVRELVEQEAAPLPDAERDALCARVVLLATGRPAPVSSAVILVHPTTGISPEVGRYRRTVAPGLLITVSRGYQSAVRCRPSRARA